MRFRGATFSDTISLRVITVPEERVVRTNFSARDIRKRLSRRGWKPTCDQGQDRSLDSGACLRLSLAAGVNFSAGSSSCLKLSLSLKIVAESHAALSYRFPSD